MQESITIAVEAYDDRYQHRQVQVRIAHEAEGNLYLYVDGVEYGSLFVQTDGDGYKLTLGQYDAASQWWTDRNPLGPVRS